MSFPPAGWRTATVSPVLLSSLRFWTVLHRCASDLKCWPLSFSRHVEPLQVNRATHTHTRTEEGKSLPPQAVTHFADRRLGQIRGACILGPALLLAEGGRKSWGESFTPPALALGILLHGVRYFQRRGSEREKQNCFFIGGKARCFICKSWFIWSWLPWDCEKNRAVQSTGGPPVLVQPYDITVYWA